GIDPPRNTNTRKLFTTGAVEFDLPLPLHIIDAEQRGILSAIGASTAPVHVTHGFAGCAISMLLQCLVATYADRHPRLYAADRGAEAILLTLQVLRREFLQGLIHGAAFATRASVLRWAVAR
ncbi:MAG: hypothetical protein ACKPKO_01455, partial [Candidatus Fonsibacter sp.]